MCNTCTRLEQENQMLKHQIKELEAKIKRRPKRLTNKVEKQPYERLMDCIDCEARYQLDVNGIKDVNQEAMYRKLVFEIKERIRSRLNLNYLCLIKESQLSLAKQYLDGYPSWKPLITRLKRHEHA